MANIKINYLVVLSVILFSACNIFDETEDTKFSANLAFTEQVPNSTTRLLHIYDINQKKDKEISDESESISFLYDFTPNGESLILDIYISGVSLYSYNLNNFERKKLTDDKGSDFFQVISNDGNKILFTSTRNNDKYMGEIYTYDLNTESLKQITSSSNGDHYAILSPDGNKIVFRRWFEQEKKYKLFIIDSDGNNIVELDEMETAGSQCFSSDGNAIIYQKDSGVYLKNLNNLEEKFLIENVYYFPHSLRALKHSNFIYCVQKDYLDPDSKFILYKFNFDNLTKQKVLVSDHKILLAGLTDNDNNLYYVVNVVENETDNKAQIFHLNTSDHTKTQIGLIDYHITHPVINPNYKMNK